MITALTLAVAFGMDKDWKRMERFRSRDVGN